MTKMTSFYLDNKLSSKLEALAALMECPKDWLIEQAIRHYVDEQGRQAQAVQEAVAELDSGSAILIPHDEVMSRFERKLSRKLQS